MDMTKLDELIKEQRDAAQKYLDAISRIDPLVYCDDTEVMDEKEETLRYIAEHHNEIADHLEELKTTRKALEFACKQITYLDCGGGCDLFEDCKTPCTTFDCGEYDLWVDFYLKKAGEENDT